MRYVIRTLLGIGLFAFCWVLIAYSIFQILQVGTCASGGPYVSARECPPGTERLILTMIGGIFLIFLALGIYATRGKPPGAPPPRNGGILVWMWTGIFWSLATGSFLAVWGPEANPGPGSRTGGLIVGFMGVVMGAGGFIGVWTRRRLRDPELVRPVVARVAQAASSFGTAASPVDRLATLDRLRAQGTITQAEFETLKSRIVEGKA